MYTDGISLLVPPRDLRIGLMIAEIKNDLGAMLARMAGFELTNDFGRLKPGRETLYCFASVDVAPVIAAAL